MCTLINYPSELYLVFVPSGSLDTINATLVGRYYFLLDAVQINNCIIQTYRIFVFHLFWRVIQIRGTKASNRPDLGSLTFRTYTSD